MADLQGTTSRPMSLHLPVALAAAPSHQHQLEGTPATRTLTSRLLDNHSNCTTASGRGSGSGMRHSKSESWTYGSTSAIQVVDLNDTSARFASVEGSSLEEKIAFLAEQRERGLDECTAFAREVEETIEKEISMMRARCGGDRLSVNRHRQHHGDPHNCGYDGAEDGEDHPGGAPPAVAMFHASSCLPDAHSTSHTHETHHQADDATAAEVLHPSCELSEIDSASCQWVKDMRYYGSTLPVPPSQRNSTSKASRRRVAFSSGDLKVPRAQAGRRGRSRACQSEGGHCSPDSSTRLLLT